jgi:hypothetical protein
VSLRRYQRQRQRPADREVSGQSTTAWAVERSAAEVRIGWQLTTSDVHIKLRCLYPA